MTDEPANPDKRIYKLSDLIAIFSMSRSQIYRAMAEQGFPTPIKLSRRSVGWWRAEVEAWFASRPSSIAPCATNDQYQRATYLNSRPGSRADTEKADA